MPKKAILTFVFTTGIFTILASGASTVCACRDSASVITFVGSFNRSQQAYFLEHNSFADSIGKLGLGYVEGLTSTSKNYLYKISLVDGAAFNYGIANRQGLELCGQTCNFGIPKPEFLKSRCEKDPYLVCFSSQRTCFYNWVGVVYSSKSYPSKENATTTSLLCASTNQSSIPKPYFDYKEGKFVCGADAEEYGVGNFTPAGY